MHAHINVHLAFIILVHFPLENCVYFSPNDRNTFIICVTNVFFVHQISFTSVWLIVLNRSLTCLLCVFFGFSIHLRLFFFSLSLLFILLFTNTSTHIHTHTQPLRDVDFSVHWLVICVLVESPTRLNEQHLRMFHAWTVVTCIHVFGLFPIQIREPIQK